MACAPSAASGTASRWWIHAFAYGQVGLPVSAMIMALGGLKHLVLERRWSALRRGLLEAYQIGRDAAPLLGVRWEALWERPLAEVRRTYGIRPLPADLRDR